MKDGGKVLSSISLGICNWAGVEGGMEGIIAMYSSIDKWRRRDCNGCIFEVFMRHEGHVNVKLGEEKMTRVYDGGGPLI